MFKKLMVGFLMLFSAECMADDLPGFTVANMIDYNDQTMYVYGEHFPSLSFREARHLKNSEIGPVSDFYDLHTAIIYLHCHDSAQPYDGEIRITFDMQKGIQAVSGTCFNGHIGPIWDGNPTGTITFKLLFPDYQPQKN